MMVVQRAYWCLPSILTKPARSAARLKATAECETEVVCSLFKAISFLVAVLNNYSMNSRWTFRQTAPQNATMRAGRFLSVSVLGLAINVGTPILGGDLR